MTMNPLQCRNVTNENYTGTFTNLKRHKKNTHREVKINCSLCTEEFASTRNLKRHVDASHKELSPHSCPICYKGFTRKDNLKRHRETQSYKSIGRKSIPKRKILHRTRFFSIRNGCQRLLNTFMEYENSLYVNKI